MTGPPLVAELIPCPDPWATARRFARLPHLIFFDSAGDHGELGRYSFVAADPVTWHCHRAAELTPAWLEGIGKFRCETVPGLPPFQGGGAGLFGYGLNRTLERVPAFAVDEFRVPDLAVGVYDCVVAFDHFQNRAWAVSTGYPQFIDSRRRERASRRLQWMMNLLNEKIDFALRQGADAPRPPRVTSNFTRQQFEAAVRRAVEYVHAGDCFQVNIAQRLLAPFHGRPLELYSDLRNANPAPFAAYFDLGQYAVLSSSPERFLRVSGRDVETRPIKGTRPRGRSAEEDRANANSLLASAKDRAENVMIVDLMRNDLGRVCEFGSVRVGPVCRLESYRAVHHLVSVVRGRLRDDLNAFDLLRAAFPGGSVTGAPKVRAMEIIAELEPTARGPYCGCLGYIGFNGEADTNILIRTMTVGGGFVQFPVGGGVVADSDPAAEYDETLAKAAGMIRALTAWKPAGG